MESMPKPIGLFIYNGRAKFFGGVMREGSGFDRHGFFNFVEKHIADPVGKRPGFNTKKIMSEEQLTNIWKQTLTTFRVEQQWRKKTSLWRLEEIMETVKEAEKERTMEEMTDDEKEKIIEGQNTEELEEKGKDRVVYKKMDRDNL